jgi:rubrerythrin
MSVQPPHEVEHLERRAAPAQALRCGNCGYGAVVRAAQPPPCPMCRETAWEPEARRPFRHLHDFWDGSAAG